MSSSSRIDTLQDDRGLHTCFEAANVEKAWSDAFVQAHGVSTLDDFVYLVDSKAWEESLKELLGTIAELKDRRLALARFKAAYESGLAAIRHSQAQPKSEDATDSVLPDSTMNQVSMDWKRRYGVILDPHLDPCDALRSRVYREFHKQTMSVIEARRVRSMVHVSIPKTMENVRLSESIQLQFQEDTSVSIGNIVEYYWAIRVLANAWSWGGLFETKDHDGAKRLFMPLTDAQHYADYSLRCTVEFGQGSLIWYTSFTSLKFGNGFGSVTVCGLVHHDAIIWNWSCPMANNRICDHKGYIIWLREVTCKFCVEVHQKFGLGFYFIPFILI